MNTKEIEKKINALGYSCHGLLDANGMWLLKPNPAKSPSKLPNVLTMLQGLPQGQYFINCSSGQGKRGAHYDYAIDTREAITEFSENGLKTSQAATQSFLESEKLGRLEAENEYLKTTILELREQIDELNEMLNEGEALDELEAAPPTMQETIMQNIAPVIPPLADKLLSVFDKWLNAGNAAQPAAPVVTNELAEQIAEIVKAKIYSDVNAQTPQTNEY